MAHSSWAWANENYQGPKKEKQGVVSPKEEHEEKPRTSQQWQQRQNSTEVQNTESGIIRNGFLTFSTFSGNPYENGFLYTFTYEPSSSQCLQKTSPFHSAPLSLSPIVFHSLLG